MRMPKSPTHREREYQHGTVRRLLKDLRWGVNGSITSRVQVLTINPRDEPLAGHILPLDHKSLG